MGRGRPGCINSPLIMVTEEKTALSPSNPAQHLTTDITIEDVAEQVRSWLQAARTRSVPAPAKLLSDLLRDPHGLEFTLAFVDRVIRPEDRSEEHTSELQSRGHLVCRLLLEKK